MKCKTRSALYVEDAITDLNVLKVASEVSCWRFPAGWCSMIWWTSWNQWLNRDINWEWSMLYYTRESQHTQNIQIKQWKSFAPAYYINRFEFGFSLIARKILVDSISTCNSPLKHNKNVLFLKQIVTANEKWILYNNEKWKRSLGKQNEPPSTTPKASLHPKKVVLYIWWDWKGVLY